MIASTLGPAISPSVSGAFGFTGSTVGCTGSAAFKFILKNKLN